MGWRHPIKNQQSKIQNQTVGGLPQFAVLCRKLWAAFRNLRFCAGNCGQPAAICGFVPETVGSLPQFAVLCRKLS
jgi:hypothetical protein